MDEADCASEEGRSGTEQQEEGQEGKGRGRIDISPPSGPSKIMLGFLWTMMMRASKPINETACNNSWSCSGNGTLRR